MSELAPGILIAFEGIDGAGKTTQARQLRDFLSEKGFNVVLTKEPTGGPFGRRLRESATTGRLPPQDELALFLDDRREHIRDLLEPSLKEGSIVIVDRYYFSTVAYQGARGLDPQYLLEKNEAFAPQPDLLVILDIDPRVGLQRVAGRGDVADLFENEEALTKSRAIFEEINKPYLLRIDGSRAITEIQLEVRETLYHGPLFRRLCSTGRDEEADHCGHMHSGLCPWIQIGTGFERAVRPASSRAIHSAIANEGLSVSEKLQAIIATARAD